jgi:hypothetical protein
MRPLRDQESECVCSGAKPVVRQGIMSSKRLQGTLGIVLFVAGAIVLPALHRLHACGDHHGADESHDGAARAVCLAAETVLSVPEARVTIPIFLQCTESVVEASSVFCSIPGRKPQ